MAAADSTPAGGHGILSPPGETESGTAGEQPDKGSPGPDGRTRRGSGTVRPRARSLLSGHALKTQFPHLRFKTVAPSAKGRGAGAGRLKPVLQLAASCIRELTLPGSPWSPLAGLVLCAVQSSSRHRDRLCRSEACTRLCYCRLSHFNRRCNPTMHVSSRSVLPPTNVSTSLMMALITPSMSPEFAAMHVSSLRRP